MKQWDEQTRRSLLARLGLIYTAAVLIWLPLYLHNGYVQAISGKAGLFYILTLGFCGAALWIGRPQCSLWQLTQGENSWLVVLCGLFFLSTLLSSDKGTSFWGLRERCNGLLMLLCCAGAFFLIRTALKQQHIQLLLRIFLGAAAVSGCIGWLNYFKIDPLGCYFSLRPEKQELFLSTVGNTNFFGAYMAMAAALALFLCAQAKTRRESLAFGGLCVLLTSALFPASSDGAWLGFYTAAAVLLWLRQTGARQICRVFTVAGLVLLVSTLAHTAAGFLPVLYPFHGLSALAAHPAFGLSAALLLFLGAFLAARSRKSPVPLVRAGVILAVFAGLLLLFAANCTRVPLGPLQDAFTFGPRWGSNRGYVWGRLWYNFNYAFTPLEKLFGIGPDGVTRVLNPHYTDYITALNGATFDSAHNVYLQLLLCCGVLSLCIAFCGLLAGLELTLFREGYLARNMEKTNYYLDVTNAIRVSCQTYAVDAGLNATSLDHLFSEENVAADIKTNMDARFRNYLGAVPSRFASLAEYCENQIVRETGEALSEDQRNRLFVLQSTCEQVYQQATRPPFDAALSTVLQYRSVRKWIWLALAALAAASVFLLNRIHRSARARREQIAVSTVGAALTLFALAGLLSWTMDWESWMPGENLAHGLFCRWLGGFPVALALIGLLLIVALLGWTFWNIQNRHQKASPKENVFHAPRPAPAARSAPTPRPAQALPAQQPRKINRSRAVQPGSAKKD